MKLNGHWPLVDIHGNITDLYTRVYVDVYKNKKSGKEYRRGKIVPYLGEREVPLIEDNADEWQFFTKPVTRKTGSVGILEEIYITQLLK